MTTFKNYYFVLSIENFSDVDVVKKAYRRQAVKFHPDKNSSTTSHEKFIEVNPAVANSANSACSSPTRISTAAHPVRKPPARAGRCSDGDGKTRTTHPEGQHTERARWRMCWDRTGPAHPEGEHTAWPGRRGGGGAVGIQQYQHLRLRVLNKPR